MRIAILCDDPDGAVVRHRIRALAPDLAAAGLDEVTEHAIPKRVASRAALFHDLRQADLVLLVRKLFTWAEVRLLRAASRRLAYDVDDAVMFRDPFRGRPVSHVRRRRFRHTVRSADLVTAGNAYLLDLAASDAPGATRLLAPTPIDTDRYAPGRSPHAGFRVGWIGSRATRGYLSIVTEALAAARDARPGLVVAVMADAPPSQLDGLPIEFTPWSESNEIAFLRSLDVGLMPLSDDPFSRGKCGFKLLQYMACGVPAIASPVGVNVEICDGGRAGLLAERPSEWVAAIAQIADDGDAARARAEAARVRVEELWSARALGPRFAAALAECARA